MSLAPKILQEFVCTGHASALLSGSFSMRKEQALDVLILKSNTGPGGQRKKM